jgi:hypothetical protein
MVSGNGTVHQSILEFIERGMSRLADRYPV